KEAYEALHNCDCQSACTKCLVDRSTQWHMENLDRHLATAWLKSALRSTLPKDLKNIESKMSSIFVNTQSEISSMDYHYGIKQINIHVNNQISNWELESLQWLENLKRNHVNVNIMVEGNLDYQNNQEKLSVFLLSHNYNLKQGVNHNIINYPIHLSMALNNGNFVSYVS